MAQEFIAEYKTSLKQLLRPDKAQINMLTMLAEDNRTYAQHIVNAIEHHLQQCTPPARLPALYLVDSIIKNAREPYTSMFCKRLDQVFGKVWDTTPAALRTPLTKLVNTWGPVLPADVVARVQARMASSGGAQHQQHQQLQHMPQHTVLQAMPAAQQVLFQQQPQQLVGHHPIPLQFGGPGGLQLVSVQQQQPQPAPLFVMGPQGQLVPVAQPQQQPQIILAQQPPPQQQHMQVVPQHLVGGLPPVSPAHPGWAQQQPQQQQVMPSARPMQSRRSPAYPASPAVGAASPHHTSSRSPHHHGLSAPGSSARSGSPAAQAEHLTASLNSLLQGLTRTGYLNDPALKTTSFDPAFLKKEHKGAVALLKAASDGTRKRFKDVQYQRNKRRRDAAASSSLLSRAWYLPVDAWITGTTVADAADAAGAQDEAGEEDEGEAAVPTVDKDPGQTRCAISHEAFEEVFDADRDTWVYRGVVRLQGAEAQRYGVQDGAIVKVECLSEADTGSSPAALAAAAAAAGGAGALGGQDEADLAAAAAAAPAAGQQHPQQQQQQQDGGSVPPAAAGAAAAAAAAGADDEHKPAVAHVKMEQQQDDGEAPDAALKLDPTAAAAGGGVDQQQQGVKREAADSQQQLQQQEGTPSKKARVSPEP